MNYFPNINSLKIIPTFINNPNFILYVFLTCFLFLVFFIFTFLKFKFKKQKIWKQSYVISYIFLIAIIFSLIFLASANFKTVGTVDWLNYCFYFSSSLTSVILIIIILFSLVLIPFRYIYSFAFLLDSHKIHQRSRFSKITFFYIWNATLAILVVCLCYFLKDPFFKYDFNPKSLHDFGYTAFFYYTRYIFNNVFATPKFSFYTIISLILMITFIMTFLTLIKKRNINKYNNIILFSKKIVDKFKWQDKIFPLFVFTATTSALLCQPLGSLLHISLVFILFIIFASIIIISNFTLSYFRLRKFFNYSQIFNSLFQNMFKRKNGQNIFNIVFKNDSRLDNFKNRSKNIYYYRILSICIFPIIITGYLGFSNIPLFEISDWKVHFWFFITLFIFPYLFSFAFVFSSASTSSFKIIINTTTAYIYGNFNSGILIYFNPIINQISDYAVFSYQLLLFNPKNDFDPPGEETIKIEKWLLE